MAEGRTKEDFLQFLDWVAGKGLLPLNTAHARKAVANKVLAALEDEELADVTALDIDSVMTRFVNKFGKRYTPDSLRTYRSRFESSIADFKSYRLDPVGFRPAGRSPSRRKNGEGAEDQPRSKGDPKRSPVRNARWPTQPVAPLESSPVPAGNVIPVQIRADLTVKIGPVPFDLTPAEAKRIANVILALAASES